jgi:hypothetical protein
MTLRRRMRKERVHVHNILGLHLVRPYYKHTGVSSLHFHITKCLWYFPGAIYHPQRETLSHSVSLGHLADLLPIPMQQRGRRVQLAYVELYILTYPQLKPYFSCSSVLTEVCFGGSAWVNDVTGPELSPSHLRLVSSHFECSEPPKIYPDDHKRL